VDRAVVVVEQLVVLRLDGEVLVGRELERKVVVGHGLGCDSLVGELVDRELVELVVLERLGLDGEVVVVQRLVRQVVEREVLVRRPVGLGTEP
jgi:hypothetical protein